MALTEKLIVKLEADVKDYVKDMEKADSQNKKTGKSGLGLAAAVSKIGGAVGAAAVPIAGLAAGVIALGAALTSMTMNSANNRRELERMARQAKTSTGEFQALAFAAKQYGLDADSVADITKDISDRLGEFATAGSGAFQDFADVMKLTASEAREAAAGMQEMSGQEALQYMVSQMESAGATTNQMTFVLESMGSELSRLTPLLVNNGAELERITGKYNDFAASIKISENEAKDLGALKENFDLLQTSFNSAATAISATLAPTLNSFIQSVLEVVPDATETIIDFVNSFKSPEDQQNINSLKRQITDITGTILAAETRLEEKKVRAPELVKKSIEKNKELREQLELQLETLEKQAAAEAKRREGGEIKGTAGSAVGEDGETITADQAAELAAKQLAEQEAELERLRQHSQTRLEALEERYMEELLMLEKYGKLTGKKEEEFAERKKEIDDRYAKGRNSILTSDEKKTKKTEKEKMDALQTGARNVQAVNELVFGDNKAVAISTAVIDTYAGINKALAKNDWVSAALVAASGFANVQSIMSTEKGGGAGGGGSTGGGGGTTITNTQADFEVETAGLEFSDSTSGGSSQSVIRFAVDSGDELIDAISTALNKAQNDGRA